MAFGSKFITSLDHTDKQ